MWQRVLQRLRGPSGRVVSRLCRWPHRVQPRVEALDERQLLSAGALRHALGFPTLGNAPARVASKEAAPARREEGAGSSTPNPGDFVAKIDNPYFPLVPGTTFFYQGTKDGQAARDETFVTHRTKNILGV